MNDYKSDDIKQIFAVSLKEIMKYKPINKITVTEIVKNSSLSRQTFYNHFKDIYDLLNYVHILLTDDLTQYFYQNKDVEKSFTLLFYRILENQCYYNQVSREEGPNSFKVYYSHLGYERGRKYIGEVALDDEVEFSLKFYWVGITQHIVNWINDGMRVHPEIMARMLSKCMPSNILPFYERSR